MLGGGCLKGYFVEDVGLEWGEAVEGEEGDEGYVLVGAEFEEFIVGSVEDSVGVLDADYFAHSEGFFELGLDDVA